MICKGVLQYAPTPSVSRHQLVNVDLEVEVDLEADAFYKKCKSKFLHSEKIVALSIRIAKRCLRH